MSMHRDNVASTQFFLFIWYVFFLAPGLHESDPDAGDADAGRDGGQGQDRLRKYSSNLRLAPGVSPADVAYALNIGHLFLTSLL